jgi:hypothetical protein
MIDAIIAALASGAASETAKDLYKRIGTGLGALLRSKRAPASATEAAEKLERGDVDRTALSAALALLNKDELAIMAEDTKDLAGAGATSYSVSQNFENTKISDTVITGMSIGKS